MPEFVVEDGTVGGFTDDGEDEVLLSGREAVMASIGKDDGDPEAVLVIIPAPMAFIDFLDDTDRSFFIIQARAFELDQCSDLGGVRVVFHQLLLVHSE